ncbi:MAG: RNA polymerase sigma factor region1.1 domain-containing protein, partial [Dongiaceae bacterium]
MAKTAAKTSTKKSADNENKTAAKKAPVASKVKAKGKAALKEAKINAPAPAAAETAEKEPKPLNVASALKKLINKAKERGFVTYDELNKALPQGQVTTDVIEDALAMISDMGLNIIESEEDDDEPKAEAAEAAEEEEEIIELGDDEEGAEAKRGNVAEESSRTDDPVRMYLREMGQVDLLSREGEIEIAKRIESGREMMIGAICESPLTVRAIGEWSKALKELKIQLRDIIDLDASYGEGEDDKFDEEEEEEAAPAVAEGEEENPAVPVEAKPEEEAPTLSVMEQALIPIITETFDEITSTFKKFR